MAFFPVSKQSITWDLEKHLREERGTHCAAGAIGMTTKLNCRVQWPITLGTPRNKHIHLTTTMADAFRSDTDMEWATALPQMLGPWHRLLSSVSQRQPKTGARPPIPGLHSRGSTALSGTSEKRRFFSFSLSFCLFLNLPGLKQQLALAWLQGLCHQQSTSLQLQKPRQPFLFPRTGVIWEDMTARKGLQTRRCFSVWSDEIFNPCSLWDMHHHRFTYLPLTDSSGWQGRWQLTYINPATQHKLSLQSRNPSLLFKHQGGVSVGTGYQAQAAPALKNRPRWGLSGAKGSRHSPEPR